MRSKIKEIRERHERDIKSHGRLSQMHKDRGILLDILDAEEDRVWAAIEDTEIKV